MADSKSLTIRLPGEELTGLNQYCESKGRTKTDVLREFIRSLKTK